MDSSLVSRLKRENAEMAMKLNNSLKENRNLTKELEQLKKDHGELLLINNDNQQKLPESRIECEDLTERLSAANEEIQRLKLEFGGKIRVLSNEVKVLKKQKGDLNEKIGDLGEYTARIEGQLVDCRLQCQKLKEKITKFEEKNPEKSRITVKNDKLERKLSSVMTATNERFRSFEKRILELERVAAISSGSGPQLVDTRHTTQVMQEGQEQENYGLEEEREGLVGAQSGHETTINKEKMASSMPSLKTTSAAHIKAHTESFGSDTRPTKPVGTRSVSETPTSEENSASSTPCVHKSPSVSPSVAEISSSDDDRVLSLRKGHKRKPSSSSDVSNKEDGAGSKKNSSKEWTMFKNGKASAFEKAQIASTEPMMTDYERLMNIEENAMRLNTLGKEKVTDSSEHDQDYVPDDNHDSADESFDGDQEPEVFTEVEVRSTPKSVPKKARAREHELRKKKKQKLCPSLALDDYMTMQEKVDITEANQLEVEVNIPEQDRLRSKHQYSDIDPSENQEMTTLSENEGQNRKGRGPSKLTNVYARKWEDRVVICCNDEGKPIGPKRSELTRFLGTIAHNHKWAPLTYISWQKVPNKEKIWKFVNSKYILPAKLKGWVMGKLDSSWRVFKCRIKRNHYYKYDSYEERLKHRPKRVPESHFKTLLAYWDSNEAKKTSLQNSRNRQEQDKMRTASPVPLAVINNQMEDDVAPSKRKTFAKTRSQKEVETNDQSDDDTLKKTQSMRRLEALQADHGRGVSHKKLKEKGADTSLIIPKEVMESIKSAITADVQNNMSSEEDELVKEKQPHVAQVAETQSRSEKLECQASKVQDMQKNFDTHEETMTLDVVALALARLRRKDPSLTPEMIANVIASTATNGA
ncbi:uncharacterized protein LOC110719645 isoform X2 [Chenopodium quinoa]|uniref:uncharacterized protein LOC110719645 isoform X2 n=1 Tax=Chenopodium quinoa TaxID=63459 RepID=UPI000B789A3B|nr:uncharacterized protein LOC110719645 isoform X2 [Chenopodium quinoa]